MKQTSILGIDIGGTKCALSRLLPDTGKVEEIFRSPTSGPEQTLERLAGEIAKLEVESETAMGISCGSPLDAKRGLILSPPNLPGWDEIPIVEFFHHRFGMPAFLMNDANACALAEWHFGAGRGSQNMIFLTAGTGMGAGLILNGQLYEGASGNAGEVGHMRLSPAGPVGFGKAGSFEGFCSGGGIARLARSMGYGNNDTTALDVANAARDGDAQALEVWAVAGQKLGEALALLIDMFNPEIIVIGSIYERSGDLLEKTMREALAKEALPDSLAACQILPAALGDHIGNYAAIAVARHHLQCING